MCNIQIMRMSAGVEWAAHSCITLDWLGDQPVSTTRLAAGFEVPPAYLNKQLQALVRAGILTSTAGARGGFQLARPLTKITLMDIVAAIEGPADAFECTEIRQRGSGARSPERALRRPCAISAAMHGAEIQWRRALAARTLAEIRQTVERSAANVPARTRAWFRENT